MKRFAILLALALLLAGCSSAPAQESTAPSTTLPVQTEPMPSVSSEPASLPPESTAPEKETEYYTRYSQGSYYILQKFPFGNR